MVTPLPFCLCLQSCQADLVKDNGHKYFLSVLADSYMPVSIHPLPPLDFDASLITSLKGVEEMSRKAPDSRGEDIPTELKIPFFCVAG